METPKLRTLSVLLVNDALEEREEYARILRISGYRAVEAATFAAAYQIATKNSVDIVVTDVRIGGSISGLELTRRLRNDTRTAAVPIIVLTTVSRPQDGDIAIKAGADISLEKPVPVPVLKAEIVRLLRLPLLISQSVQTRQPSSGRSKPGTLTRSSKPKVDTARNPTYVRDNLHRRRIAGSENSDQILSGNSDHLPVALPGQTIVGNSASDEGKDDRHAQATRDSGAAPRGAHVDRDRRAQRRFGEDGPTDRGRRPRHHR